MRADIRSNRFNDESEINRAVSQTGETAALAPRWHRRRLPALCQLVPCFSAQMAVVYDADYPQPDAMKPKQ
jgi:hypothetical protein